MNEPVVNKYDTKENLFLKFWIPSLHKTLALREESKIFGGNQLIQDD